MNEISVPLELDTYAIYLDLEAIVDRLNGINPKMPITLQLTSWEPDLDGNPEITGPAFAEITGTKSRLMHVTRSLNEVTRMNRRMREIVKDAIPEVKLPPHPEVPASEPEEGASEATTPSEDPMDDALADSFLQDP